jgi:hypothetical protein
MKCKFTIIHTNESFNVDIISNQNIGNIYDSIRHVIQRPFDLIYKSDGVDGKYMNKNTPVDLNYSCEFYVRTLCNSECEICCLTGLINTLQCGHSLCSNCYSRVSLCPYCRRQFTR